MKASFIKKKVLPYLILHSCLLFYSFGSICSKMASRQKFLSFKFIVFYGLLIAILGVYAILWQQILKKIPLSIAYANKSVGVIWGMIWGAVIFSETITLNMIIGAVFVVAGVIFLVTCNE